MNFTIPNFQTEIFKQISIIAYYLAIQSFEKCTKQPNINLEYKMHVFAALSFLFSYENCRENFQRKVLFKNKDIISINKTNFNV